MKSMKSYAPILVGLLLICRASPTRADEPEAVYIEEGAPAPFAGILFPPARAERLGERLETCELRRDLDAQFATDKHKIQLDSCAAKQALADEAALEREKLLRTALEDAREDARREAWEEPSLVLTTGLLVGIVIGAGAIVGAVYLVGQLRPLVPAP